ncbi:MAG: DNA polymerase I [Bacillota bacterium]|nr:DNA polymerase I [Bacillota bacterium]
MNKILLIDGSNILHRAYHALPPLKTTEGRYTNAAYGFMMMLKHIMQRESPTHIAICFDKGKNTFRHRKFSAYKAQRKPTDPELVEQFPLIREILTLNGFLCLELDEFEADDIIGTLARRGQEHGDEVIIFSGDKDLLQMIDDHITVFSGKRTLTDLSVTDTRAFREKYGLEPKRLIDLKALMGDASDNIPGVAGVGEKTALKLLHQFGSLEGVYDHIDELPKNKMREKLERDKDNAFLSKYLATIIDDVPLEVTLDDMCPKEKDWHALRDLYRSLEFRGLLKEVEAEMPIPESTDMIGSLFDEEPQVTEVDYQIVDHSASFLRRAWESMEPLAMLMENGHCYFATSQNQVAVLDLSVTEDEALLLEVFQNFQGEIVSHDLKSIYHYCMDKGLFPGYHWDDLEIMAYLLEANVSSYEMNFLMNHYLGIDSYTIAEKDRPFARVISMLSLKEKLMASLEEQGTLSLYQNVERPLIAVLADMEFIGIRVDRGNLKEMSTELEQRVSAIREKIYESAGCKFNLNSPKQMGEILFERLHLPKTKKTKTKSGYSTSNEVLEPLREEYPIVNEILSYRQLFKLKSTYTDALEKLINPQTGHIHTKFRQSVTTTGRLSSTDPNLQNIPVRLDEGRLIRKAFTASSPDHILLAADYSQIELRLLAHYADDSVLIDAFCRGEDIHARTASEIFGVPLTEVDRDMRRKAKAVNFGIIYGISEYGLGRDLGIMRYEAKEYMDQYFHRYPNVEKFQRDMVEQAKKDGYITTLYGRRRYIPEINSRNFHQRAFAERTAMNTPLQGSAADIIKEVMVILHHRLREEGFQSRIILQVHDELILNCPKEELYQVVPLVREVMEHTKELKVPLTVDVKSGYNWYNMDAIHE